MNITTLKTYADGSGTLVSIVAGEIALDVCLDPKGRISWASDWIAVHALVDAGLARTEFSRHLWGHLWGHTDVYIDAAVPAAS